MDTTADSGHVVCSFCAQFITKVGCSVYDQSIISTAASRLFTQFLLRNKMNLGYF